MSLRGTRAGNIHQREGSEVRNLQKVLSRLEEKEMTNEDVERNTAETELNLKRGKRETGDTTQKSENREED